MEAGGTVKIDDEFLHFIQNVLKKTKRYVILGKNPENSELVRECNSEEILNLIKSRKQGKEVWYSLADEHVKEVFDISLEHIMEKNND